MFPKNATINGHECSVSVIPHKVPNPRGLEYDRYIFKFQENLVPTGPSFLIIEWFENEIGEWDWRIEPGSPIQDREDLLKAAGELIDNYFANESNFKKDPD